MTFVKCQAAAPAMAARLRQHPWFLALDENTFKALASHCRDLNFQPGQEIFSHGDPCNTCMLVFEGQLQGLRYTQEGEEKIFGHISPGAFIGLHSLFAQPPLHWHTIRAVTTGNGCLLEAGALRKACLAAPALALSVIEHGARLLRHHTEQIDWLTSSTAEQRLADYILRFGKPQSDDARIQLPLSWAQIATKLGMRPETLSRLLAKWRRQGFIRSQRASLYVLDSRALREIVRTDRVI
ncbi:Crp/Fnr family transcriptional regulator [Kerstersia gyiorum]|uniref:Crp/Fnr family transcriptional regulator n=1 Tax=Kerstersia gyiorum TaxID=206506 RepID=UPI001F0EAF01|nr:Crp/Fnr family transcriptional regulator [Kerstersia gyiorum]MCR4157390.1 Crp/Fnr family transcriptional regulator [Kerstersia gyiorum]